MTRAVAWCLLIVWAAWLFALQGLWASSPEIWLWTPDLGICVLLAFGRRLDREDGLLALGIVSAARCAFSSDPPIAILVGYGALVFSARRVRRVIDIDSALPRAVFAAVFAVLLTAYWSVARRTALAADGFRFVQETLSSARLARVAFSTALSAAMLAPLIIRLPGLSPLSRRPR